MQPQECQIWLIVVAPLTLRFILRRSCRLTLQPHWLQSENEMRGRPTGGAARELLLGQVGNPLEVVVAGVAEVGCSEAEEDCHGAAVAALVL